MKRGAALLFMGLMAAPAARAEELEPGGKVYSGGEGITVSIVALKPRADRRVLIKVSGSESELDELVLLHKVQEWNDNADYLTTRKGRDYYTVNMRQRYGSKEWSLNLPGRRDSVRLSFDEKRTAALDAPAMLARYLELEKSGALKKLATFDRAQETADEDRAYAESLADFQQACGSKAGAKIDWATVSDEQVKALSVASFCSSPLNALRSICEDPDGKQAVQQKVKQVSCRFGDKLSLVVDGSGAVQWTTAKDAPNQDDFAKQALMKQL